MKKLILFMVIGILVSFGAHEFKEIKEVEALESELCTTLNEDYSEKLGKDIDGEILDYCIYEDGSAAMLYEYDDGCVDLITIEGSEGL